MIFKPSEYQLGIFHFIKETNDNLLIEAVAGSGKTTTILRAMDFIPKHRRCLFLAFNKDIATELASKVPSNVMAKTFHSICFGGWMRYMGDAKVTVDADKVKKIMEKRFGDDDLTMYAAFVSRLVGYGKNEGISYLIPDTPDEWHRIASHYDLMLDTEGADMGRAIELAHKTLQASDRCKQIVDYDDMLRLPLLYELSFFPNDIVFVDEAQDTNPIQRALLRRMVRPRTGRLIAVGDSAQAIYGFRGASNDAMDLIKREFNCRRLPLSVSYRCSKAVVKAASQFVPSIESFPGAPEGSLQTIPLYHASEFKKDHAVICRNTAPLVGMAYGLIFRGIPCRILGREIGDGLVKLVKKMKAKGIDSLIKRLEAYREREVGRAMAKGKEAAAEAIDDRVTCVMAFIELLGENGRTIPSLVASIQLLFSDDKTESIITLCTAHKSKGMEWETVWLLDAEEYMPSKWARQEWQQVQELNLIYVAYTRAKLHLRFIKSRMWKEGEEEGKEKAKPM